MVDVTFRYNTNLANYKGIAPGKLAVDAGTLITFAKADLSGAQLDLLLRSGRDVVITSTIRTEATIKGDLPDARTIEDWITRNANNPHLIIDNSPLNPAYVPQSDNGEISIIGYIQRTGGDIRVVTEDLKWMEGLRTGLAAARDLAGTSGVNLTTNEFVNDLMISGSISPYEHALAALQILKIDPVRSNPEQQNLLFRPGDVIPLEFQNGTTGHVFYGGPLGAVAVDEHGVLIGVPAIFGLRLNIPKSSPLKFTEADHSDDTASLAYGPIEDINGKLAVVGEDTGHSSLLQQARFEYDPDAGTMTRSLVKDDGTSTKSVFDTGTKPWSSDTSAFDVYQRLQSQRVDFDGGGQQVKQYDSKNTHPYNELDVTKAPDGKVTTAQVVLDQNIINAGGAVGQIFGSALGAALGGKDQLSNLVSSTAGGVIGSLVAQKFIQVLATSMRADLSKVSLVDVFSSQGINIAGAGIGAVSSFLTAELGTALHIGGFGGTLFNIAGSSLTFSVLSQVVNSHLAFDAAIAAIDWTQAVSGAFNAAELNLDGVLGGYLAHEFVPAKTHEGAVGGELLGAIGNMILPGGLGSFIGTLIGTLIFNQFGTSPSPGAVDLLDQAGTSYNSHEYQASDHGTYDYPNKMAPAADAIINAYLGAVKGVALDHSKQVTLGYIMNPDLLFISGVPGHTDHSFTNADDAVHAAALDVLQNLEVIGGDLLLKRAHHNSDRMDRNRNRGGHARRPVRASGWRPAKATTTSMPCIHKRFA